VDTIAALDKKRTLYSQRLELHKDLFSTLLHQLMTAQIRVNDIDLTELGVEAETA
jgi:type I restriction enzyme S subunit